VPAFYKTGYGALTDERDGHRMGADVVARDAASGVEALKGVVDC
jgi:methanogenic corrinoid protein MtbC1